MGLASLIKVAQGKNAGNVSFEDHFCKEYDGGDGCTSDRDL